MHPTVSDDKQYHIACLVCAVYANWCRSEFRSGAGEESAIKVANEAAKILSEWDTKKRKKKKQWLFPSLLATE